MKKRLSMLIILCMLLQMVPSHVFATSSPPLITKDGTAISSGSSFNTTINVSISDDVDSIGVLLSNVNTKIMKNGSNFSLVSSGTLNVYSFIESGDYILQICDSDGNMTVTAFTITVGSQQTQTITPLLVNASVNVDQTVGNLFSGSIAGQCAYSYSFNGNNLVSCDSSTVLAVEGTYSVYCTPQVGVQAISSFLLDKTPPTWASLGVTDKAVYTTTKTITFQQDVKKATVTLDGAVTYTKNADWTTTQYSTTYDGVYSVTIEDSCGNVAPVLTFNVAAGNIDTSSIGVTNGAIYSVNKTLSFSSSMTNVVVKRDNIDVYSKQSSSPESFTTSSDGIYSIIISNSYNTTPVVIGFTISSGVQDKTPPDTTLTTVASGTTYEGSKTITFVSDVRIAYVYRDNVLVYTKDLANSTSQYVADVPGTYSISLFDLAGNKSMTTFYIIIPAQILAKAKVGFKDLPEAGVAGDSVTISSTDDNFYKYTRTAYKDGKLIDWPVNSLFYESGQYRIELIDTYKRVQMLSFEVLLEIPDIDGLIDDMIIRSDTYKIIAKDNVKLTLDGVSIVSGKLAGEGAHTLIMEDNAGSKVTRTFKVDAGAPIIAGSPKSGITKGNVVLNITDGTELSIVGTLDGKPLIIYSNMTLGADGEYVITATDIVGNKTNVKFSIDNTVPTIIALNTKKLPVGYSEATKSKVKISVKDVNLASVVITLNKKVIKMPKNNTLTAKGVYVITAKDKAGNVAVFTCKKL